MKRRHSGFRPVLFSMLLALCFAGSASAQSTTGWIRLDTVTHQLSPTQLIAGNTHRVAIRYHFPDEANPSFWDFSSAFELYSPDGADWSNLFEQDGALIVNCPVHVFFRKYYTSQDDGLSWQMTASRGATLPGPSTGPNSRAAFSVVMNDAGGYPCFTSGLDGLMIYLDFQTHSSDIGRTICVDTVNGRGTVPWEWAGAAYGSRIPVWDDGLGESAPRCWEIAACTGPDSDDDGVTDMCDVCPGYPDNVDTDDDGIPDGCDSCIDCGPEKLDVRIDSVEGLQAPGVLASGRPLKFRFRLSASNDPIAYFTTTMLLYSPDGAVWSPPVLDTVDGFDALTSGAAQAIWSYSADGQSVDTVRIMTGSMGWPTDVFPPGFSEVLFTIETSVDADQAGLTLCIDRSLGPYGTWFSAWNYATGLEETPHWSGPYCYTISPECCIGRVGDVNGIGGDEPTAGDLATIIDHLFISGMPLTCFEEADVNQSGGATPTAADVTIGDVLDLIDYLFIAGPASGVLPDCM